MKATIFVYQDYGISVVWEGPDYQRTRQSLMRFQILLLVFCLN